MPFFSSKLLHNFLNAFRECFSYLIGVISSIFDVICSSPLYYIPVIAFMLLSMVGVVMFVIQNVGHYSLGSDYNTRFINNKQYADPQRYYCRTPYFGYFLNRFGLGYWKRKKEAETKAKEQSRAFLEDWEKADEFFFYNPLKMSVRINGKTFYNSDNGYKQLWGNNGRMRHTTIYKRNKDGTYTAVKQSHTVTEVEDD